MARVSRSRAGQRWLAVPAAGLLLTGLILLVVRQGVLLPSPPGASVPASTPLAAMDQQQTSSSPWSDLTLQRLDGSELKLSDIVRGKPSVLWFMAAWCSSCLAEARTLGQIYQEFGRQGLQVIAIDVEPTETRRQLEGFKNLVRGADYLWAFDRTGAVLQAFQVRYLDTTIVIDGAGKVVHRDEVVTPYDVLRPAVQRVISGSNGTPGCC